MIISEIRWPGTTGIRKLGKLVTIAGMLSYAVNVWCNILARFLAPRSLEGKEKEEKKMQRLVIFSFLNVETEKRTCRSLGPP